ncbi:uncharacterized protein CC84DRAFT_1238265 [Paraphaeosphaeria sporulosa]|uniref:Uncharacterized protein n=1 Tax=Paraphaeosphaeria sporulosa TaxID=1460663 RepID=A0A177CU04_9PLEO|nr:uncharacterized protein CC84DRAFT_1238265 [Paraphaeosphaeria sporulosa]OAG11004.1 hypothetical protein CC84DRAFT_1238265 [Paraphaeosphaeria sporulosa]
MIYVLAIIPVLFIFLQSCKSSNVSSSTRPVVIPPSVEWDGPDGTWSSFDIIGGSDKQKIWRFAATAYQTYSLPTNTTWCGFTDTRPSICEERGICRPPKSKSWVPAEVAGMYPLYTRDGEIVTGDIGIDTVTVEIGGNQILVPEQCMEFIASENFAMALFGLGSQHFDHHVDFGNGSSKSSKLFPLMDGLRDMGVIQFHSYSYRTGSRYRNQRASLIVDGYDPALKAKGYKTLAWYLIDEDVPDRGLVRGLVVRLSSVSFRSGSESRINNSPEPIEVMIDS